MARTKVGVSVTFKPRPDITAYELAQCLPLILPAVHSGILFPARSSFVADQVKGKEIERHFDIRALPE